MCSEYSSIFFHPPHFLVYEVISILSSQSHCHRLLFFSNKLPNSSENSTVMENPKFRTERWQKLYETRIYVDLSRDSECIARGSTGLKIRRRLNTPGFWRYFFISVYTHVYLWLFLIVPFFVSGGILTIFNMVIEVCFCKHHPNAQSFYNCFYFRVFQCFFSWFNKNCCILYNKKMLNRMEILNKVKKNRIRWIQCDVIFVQISTILHISNMDFR